MVNVMKPADYKQAVGEFLKAASSGVDEGAKAFNQLVDDLGGNFHLAVLNVGDCAFGRVLGCEGEIRGEEKRQYPNVAESIASARASRSVRCDF